MHKIHSRRRIDINPIVVFGYVIQQPTQFLYFEFRFEFRLQVGKLAASRDLLGQNTAPNPLELLLAAPNACMSVVYAANAAMMGIKIHSLEIETDTTLDLRGFLGLDHSLNPGNDEVSVVVRLYSDAPRERVEELHNIVIKTSVNYANFSKAIRMVPNLEVREG